MEINLYNLCSTDSEVFLNYDTVQGVGYGLKETNSIQTTIPCIKIMVSEKLPLDKLTSEQIIPRKYKGYHTDIIEVGTIYACSNTSKIRPAVGGISVGIQNVPFAGTLSFETHGYTSSLNETYLLSNNHVISNENTTLKYSSLLQPAQGDGGNPATDSLAYLVKSIPLLFTTSISNPTNYVDCALGLITIPSLITDQIISIGTIQGIAPPELNLPIQKSGRTTGYTTGTILSINSTVNVSYVYGTAKFSNQIVTTTLVSPGDSGSALLDMDNRIVGLIFAGSSSVGIANDISDVFTFLGIQL
ncbi:MAG: trypsin-like serine protease [Clostridium sp.]